MLRKFPKRFRTLLLNRCFKIHISGEICKRVLMPLSGIYILVIELAVEPACVCHSLKSPYNVYHSEVLRYWWLRLFLQTLDIECVRLEPLLYMYTPKTSKDQHIRFPFA